MTDTTEEKKSRKNELTVREVNIRLDTEKRNSVARFRTVNNNIKKIDKSIDARAAKVMDKHIKRLEKLNNLSVLDKKQNEATKRLDYISDRMRYMIHRETVLTELSRYVRNKKDVLLLSQFHIAMMKAFDMPDTWWGANSHEMLISEWYDRIMGLLHEDYSEGKMEV